MDAHARKTIRVRISSDEAGAIALTPVVVQELALGEFMEHVVSVCGKDPQRVAELLRRGSMVSGASRFRWEGWSAGVDEAAALLAPFPDAEPGRAFDAQRCFVAVLHAGLQQIVIPKEAAAKRRWFKREDFWSVLLRLGESATYVEYSYRYKADVYRTAIAPATQERLLTASTLLTYGSLTRQLGAMPVTHVDLFVRR